MNWVNMYFDKDICKRFAQSEQNDKNYEVAEIIDNVIMSIIWNLKWKLSLAELWWWAHPDRYHKMFEYLINNWWNIDWIDISPFMIELANQYLDKTWLENRKSVINYIIQDIIEYLKWKDNESIDIAIMKYTLDHIQNIDLLFKLLSKKLKKWWHFVATITLSSNKLKSSSANVAYFFDWEQPEPWKEIYLQDWDSFEIKWYKETFNPDSWFQPGAQTIKYYYSDEYMNKLAKKYWFEIFFWDWKEYLPYIDENDIIIKQKILVLKRIK